MCNIHDDIIPNILVCLDAITIKRVLISCKYFYKLINNRSIVEFLFNKNIQNEFNTRVPTKNLWESYILKLSIIDSIQYTLDDFNYLMRKHLINDWAVIGGMCMRYHGIRRMTYDLDIIISSHNQLNSVLFNIFKISGWIRISIPGNTWLNPMHKIKIRILQDIDERYDSKVCYNNINYLSILKLFIMKNTYSTQITEASDCLSIINMYPNVIVKKNIHETAQYFKIYYRIIKNYKHTNIKSYLTYKKINFDIIKDITSSEPPDKHISWQCWYQSYKNILKNKLKPISINECESCSIIFDQILNENDGLL